MNEELSLARQGAQQGAEDMIKQVIQLLMQGVSPEELIQKGVPAEVIQMAMEMIKQQEQQSAAPQVPAGQTGLAGSMLAQGTV